MEPINDINDPTLWVGTRSKKDKKRHKKERATKGYSRFDFWNFFQYHSWVMVQVLEDFKTGMGHPVSGEVSTMEEWVGVLTEIQDGFRAHSEMSEFTHLPSSPEYVELDKRFRRGMKLFTDYYGTFWD
jgi:hypothetical protein